jgi:hypothetical protein
VPTPDESAQWIIEQVVDEAQETHTPLTSEDIAALGANIRSEQERGTYDRDATRKLNNRVVVLARQRMERAKRAGAPTTRVRPGLRVPDDWLTHYQNVYDSQHPWAISAMMQHAMIGNPLARERKPWKSD